TTISVHILRFRSCYILTFLCVTLASGSWCRAQQMVVAPDRANGVYQVGDTVHWTVEWKGDMETPPAHYTLKSGGWKEVEQGELSFHNKVALLETKFHAPGALLVEVKWQGAGIAHRTVGGAVAAPERIKPAAPAPRDFDAFWKARLQELAKVPF